MIMDRKWRNQTKSYQYIN